MNAFSRLLAFLLEDDGWIRSSVAPTVRDYRRRFETTLARWLIAHQREIVFQKCSWMGVKALKNPLDAWIYQEILHEVRPDVLVEIGSHAGGSTLYFAHLLELLGNGAVLSVDLDHSCFVAAHARIAKITGNSSSPEVLAKVREACAGKRTLVVHDGDHRSEQVLADLENYAPLVSAGSYFIVEDGIVDLFSPDDGFGSFEKGGPLVAVSEFLTRHAEFVVDSSRERYVLTYNPRGFLKRV